MPLPADMSSKPSQLTGDGLRKKRIRPMAVTAAKSEVKSEIKKEFKTEVFERVKGPQKRPALHTYPERKLESASKRQRLAHPPSSEDDDEPGTKRIVSDKSTYLTKPVSKSVPKETAIRGTGSKTISRIEKDEIVALMERNHAYELQISEEKHQKTLSELRQRLRQMKLERDQEAAKADKVAKAKGSAVVIDLHAEETKRKLEQAETERDQAVRESARIKQKLKAILDDTEAAGDSEKGALQLICRE